MNNGLRISVWTVCVLFLLVIGAAGEGGKATVEQRAFGKTADGSAVTLYVLTNRNGMQPAITNYGGILVSLKVPDRTQKLADIVLGYDSVEGYAGDKTFQGAIIGRYGNRIAHGKFTLNGEEYP